MIERPGGRVDAIEAKTSPGAFEAASLKAFREVHREGRNLLVCPFVPAPHTLRLKGFEVQVCGVWDLSAGVTE
ncbi:MAG: hypothetical protein HYU36_10600 [Planctomycetes bacterium]|nr:hypothetical protein [Planctomycetota bacterium]